MKVVENLLLLIVVSADLLLELHIPMAFIVIPLFYKDTRVSQSGYSILTPS